MFLEPSRGNIIQVIMLVSTFRKIVPCNLRRMGARVAYRNRTSATRTVEYCNESQSSPMSPNVAVCRLYCTPSKHTSRVTLPMLVDVVHESMPPFFTPLKLLYVSIYKMPNIDKEFDITEFIKGAVYAMSVISKALANKDYDSLDGLVAEDTIETLKPRIETLSPNQRQVIAVNEKDILFKTITDINVESSKTANEHSISISTMCHYIPNFEGNKEKLMGMSVTELSKEMVYIICTYTFVRKYVNNVGGTWIATFVNHYSLT